MSKFSTIFKTLQAEISRYEFQKAVDFFQGDKHIRTLSTQDLFSCVLFGHITNCFSIREIEQGLLANGNKLYHGGLSAIKRSTFADALAKRDFRIFSMLYEDLLGKATVLAGSQKRKFISPLKCIDATTIEVNVNRFPWAKFRQTKGGMKLHMSYDPDRALPDQMFFTDGKVADINRLSFFPVQEGEIQVFDRGYCDYKSLYHIELREGFFVTRLKKNACYEIEKVQHESETGPVLKDLAIRFTQTKAIKAYPKPLRLIEYYDAQKERTFLFLTNNFTHRPDEIAEMYKTRWEIELFFKWMKQNLKIKTFWGTSKNAVLVQIWIALILYLLLWIMKAKNCIEFSLQRIRQMLKTTLFDRRPIERLFLPPPLEAPPETEYYLFEDIS
jgi:hypothetical protein